MGTFSSYLAILLPASAFAVGLVPNETTLISSQDVAIAAALPYVIVVIAFLIGGNFRLSGRGTSTTHELVYCGSGHRIRAATTREAFNHQHGSAWAWDQMVQGIRKTLIWSGLVIAVAAAFLPMVWPKVQPVSRQWISAVFAAVIAVLMFIACGVLRAAFFWSFRMSLRGYPSRDSEAIDDERRAMILLLISLLAHLLQIVGVIPVLIALFGGEVAPWLLKAGAMTFCCGLAWQMILACCSLPYIRSFKEVWS